MANSADGMNYYDKFYNYLMDLLQNYTKLAVLLRQKLDAVSKYDMNALDGILKEEQVFVLLSKGFDSNLQIYRDKLSLSGDSLGAVIEEMPEAQRPRYRALFVELKAKLDEVKEINEKCQALLEERLYTIEKAIRQLDKSGTAAYGKPGAGKAQLSADPHILEKLI